MEKVIIFNNNSGGVSVCIPTGEIPIEEVLAKDVPQNVASYVVEAESLPKNDWDFFDAWEQSNGVVSINIAKAREVAKNRLRKEREPLLAQQDIAFQRALESGASTAEIVAEKKRLRDVTKLANACSTLDQLRALKV